MTTRARDEEVLEMLRLRNQGVATSKIAAMFGTEPAAVLNATNNVLIADLRESGEKPGKVSKHYWGRK